MPFDPLHKGHQSTLAGGTFDKGRWEWATLAGSPFDQDLPTCRQPVANLPPFGLD